MLWPDWRCDAMGRVTIKSIFEAWARSAPEMSRVTCDAIDAVRDPKDFDRMDRANRDAALTMWGDIARGDFTPEHLAFVQAVAESVLQADTAGTSRERADAAYHATGLAGTRDRYAGARAAFETIEMLGGQKLTAKAKRAHLARQPSLIPERIEGTTEADRNDLIRVISASAKRGKK